MDFTNRSSQTEESNTAPAPKNTGTDHNKWGRVSVVLMAGAILVLLIALVAFISFGDNKGEDKYVDTSKLQAVVLNTGQVYFGNIQALNSKYIVLTNIYYLQSAGSATNSGKTSSTVPLVKLGCEVYKPYDQMVINSDQVTLWENIQDDGQVAKAIANFEKQNPNGQKCADQSTGSSTNSTSTNTNTSTNSTSTNSTSTSPASATQNANTNSASSSTPAATNKPY